VLDVNVAMPDFEEGMSLVTVYMLSILLRDFLVTAGRCQHL
jgi:hypothetical protein